MSGISISPYFPFRRIKITKQAVDAAAAKAVIDVIPDQRFVPVCHVCGKKAASRPQLDAAAGKGSQGVPGLGDEGDPAADVGVSGCDPDAQVLQALGFLGDSFAAEADD